MNPYTYKNFVPDMIEATSEFISKTNYEVEKITSSSISLINSQRRISFYIEGASMVSVIEQVSGLYAKGIYELFLENNIFDKYPVDKENTYSYEEWNKISVKKQLEVLRDDLYNYL